MMTLLNEIDDLIAEAEEDLKVLRQVKRRLEGKEPPKPRTKKATLPPESETPQPPAEEEGSTTLATGAEGDIKRFDPETGEWVTVTPEELAARLGS